MTDYGITASQEGIDLKEATDAQKTLDSRWRYMDILQEEVVSFGATSGIFPRTNIYKHDLGFVPAFDVYNTTTNSYIPSAVTSLAANGIFADNTYVFYVGEWDAFSEYTNSNAIIRIYNIPITEEYSTSVTRTLTKGKSTSSRYGVKILNPKKSGELKDNEMTGFSLNTGSKGLAVHQTGTVMATPLVTWAFTIQHGLGNTPIFMTATCADNKSYVSPITTDFLQELSQATSSTQLSFKGAQASIPAGRYAYIIFKEFADFAV